MIDTSKNLQNLLKIHQKFNTNFVSINFQQNHTFSDEIVQCLKSKTTRIDCYLASYFAKTLYFMAELFYVERTQPFYLLKFVKDTFSFYIFIEFPYVSLDGVKNSQNILKKCSMFVQIIQK